MHWTGDILLDIFRHGIKNTLFETVHYLLIVVARIMFDLNELKQDQILYWLELTVKMPCQKPGTQDFSLSS